MNLQSKIRKNQRQNLDAILKAQKAIELKKEKEKNILKNGK
jgi:hypothetical protein